MVDVSAAKEVLPHPCLRGDVGWRKRPQDLVIADRWLSIRMTASDVTILLASPEIDGRHSQIVYDTTAADPLTRQAFLV
jgi:hypothetical protein